MISVIFTLSFVILCIWICSFFFLFKLEVWQFRFFSTNQLSSIDTFTPLWSEKKNTWHYSNLPKLVRTCLGASAMICPGESSVCAREEWVFCYCWRSVLYMSVRRTWSILSFKSAVSLLLFCQDDLSIVVSGVLKFPTIIVFSDATPWCQ